MHNSRLLLVIVTLLAFISGLIAAPFSYFRETQQVQLQQHTLLLTSAPLLDHLHYNNNDHPDNSGLSLSSRNANIRTPKTKKAITGKCPPLDATDDERLPSSAPPLTPQDGGGELAPSVSLQLRDDELTLQKKTPYASSFYFEPNVLDGEEENEPHHRRSANSGWLGEEMSAQSVWGRTNGSSSSSIRSNSPALLENTLADFSSRGGRWAIRPNNSQGEPVRHWIPNQRRRRRMIRGSSGIGSDSVVGVRGGAANSPLSPSSASSSRSNEEIEPMIVEEPYESALWLGPQKNSDKNNEEYKNKAQNDPLSLSSSLHRPLFRPWLRFDQIDALRCLSGRRMVFIGNSNTRTLMTAFQSLLEGIPQMSRVSAKQQCDNSKYNHSCWLVINNNNGEIEKGEKDKPVFNGGEAPGGSDSNDGANITNSLVRALRERRRRRQSAAKRKENEKGKKPNGDAKQNFAQRDLRIARRLASQVRPIHLHYVSYTNGLYHPELEERVAKPFFPKGEDGAAAAQTADMVVMNIGLNFLQKMWDDVWRKEHEESAPHLRAFIRRFLLADGSSSRVKSEINGSINKRVFFWHTTTPLCRAMPHFRRYKYRKSNWQSRSLESTNAAIDESNRFVVENVLKKLVNHEEENMDTREGQGERVQKVLERGGAKEIEGRRKVYAANSRRYADGSLVLVDGHAMLSPADLTTPNALEKAMAVQMERHGGAELPSAEMTGVMPSGTSLDDVCNSYDDPLHHRFFDRELVQVILNHYCVEDNN